MQVVGIGASAGGIEAFRRFFIDEQEAEVNVRFIEPLCVQDPGSKPSGSHIYFGVEFKSGTTYHYADVPSSKYEAFLIAPSAGKYFIGNIKNEHPFTKIDPPAKEKATADQECGAA